MTPDEEHTEYFKKKPMGNHDEPSGETLRFMLKQEEINDKLVDGVNEMRLALLRIEGKVDYTNGKVGEQEKFKNTYEPFLSNLVDKEANEKENKKSWQDSWRELLFVVILGGFVMAIITKLMDIIFKKYV